MPTMSENKKAGKADTFLSWTLGVLACLWVAWCCGIGPLYWFGTGLADFGWANVLYMAIAFVVSFAILWSLVRYGRGERVLPTYFSRRYVKLCQEVSGTPTTVLGIMLRHLSDAAHSRPGRAIHAVIVWIGRKLTRCTDCWWKLMLLFVIGFCMLLFSRNLIKKVIGLDIMDSGIFLLLADRGYIAGRTAPIIVDGVTDMSRYVNPIPAGLVLTGIVVSVSVSAVMLSLTVRIYKTYRTLDVDKLYMMISHKKKRRDRR